MAARMQSIMKVLGYVFVTLEDLFIIVTANKPSVRIIYCLKVLYEAPW